MTQRGMNVIRTSSEVCHSAYLLMKLLKLSYYINSIGEYKKQNISNLELTLFHLKHKVSTKLLSITQLFG